MDDDQKFKNTVMKRLYSIMNHEDEIDENFLNVFNSIKFNNSINEKLEKTKNELSLNPKSEKTYDFIRSFIPPENNEEKIGLGALGEIGDNAGFNVPGTIPYSYKEFIEKFTNACRHSLNEDFKKYSKIHKILKDTFSKNLIDEHIFSKIFKDQLPLPSGFKPTPEEIKINEEITKNIERLSQYINVFADKESINVSYYVLEIVIGYFKIILICNNIPDEDINFLMSFYMSHLSMKAIYLTTTGSRLNYLEIMGKFYEFIKFLLNNESFFRKEIKQIDRVGTDIESVTKLVSKIIFEFQATNVNNIVQTASKSIQIISDILSAIQDITTNGVKMGLKTFDYIMMCFIATHKGRLQTIGFMNAMVVLAIINSKTSGSKYSSAGEKSVDEIQQALVGKPKNLAIPSVITNYIELEFLVLHRILTASFKKLINTKLATSLINLQYKLKTSMEYSILPSELTTEKKTEYLEKYMYHLKMGPSHYPVSSFTDLPDITNLSFWWITKDETLVENTQTIPI